MKTKLLKIATLFLFVSFYSCTEETIYITPEDTEGRVNVYIEGDITNAEAAEQLKNEVGTLTQNIYVQHTTQLTEIDIKIVKDLKYIFIDNNNSLQKTTIEGGGETFVNVIKIEKNNSLTDVLIEKIKNVNFIIYKGTDKQQPEKLICNDLENIYVSLDFSTHINNNNILQFNHLKTIGTRADSYIIENNWQQEKTYLSGKCSTVDFPNLEEIFYLVVSQPDGGYMPLIIDTLSFPKLKKIESFKSEFGYLIKTLNLPQLTYCRSLNIFSTWSYSLPLLSNDDPILNFPLLNYIEYFRMELTQTNTSKVNYYLSLFVNASPISGKYIDLSGETGPTGQGLIDAQTLINQGNTVLHN